MELFEAMSKRHSFRAFKKEPVPRDVLDKMMLAASLAPSSMNEQPWRFYIAVDEARARVGEVLVRNTAHVEEYLRVIGVQADEHAERWFAELGDAPVVIACTMSPAEDDFARLNKQIAMGCAMQNIMLAAVELGVATCAVTFAYWVRDDLAQVLGIPEERTVIAMMAVGYPAVDPVDTDRHADIAVYRD